MFPLLAKRPAPNPPPPTASTPSPAPPPPLPTSPPFPLLVCWTLACSDPTASVPHCRNHCAVPSGPTHQHPLHPPSPPSLHPYLQPSVTDFDTIDISSFLIS
eukprot:759190-Hanusia_phi.AAC.4